MRHFTAVLLAASLVVLVPPARVVAADCAGNPDAIGTSRVIAIDPTEHLRLGTMQYRYTLPLAQNEVVLTFDDGPLPPYSDRILDILAAHCVKATYFIVGRMARAYPDVVRRIQAAGHTVGTHSQNHPFSFHYMARERVQQEVEQGIASTAAALGDPKMLAPFFRIPGLARGPIVERYLAEHHLMTWSADFPADDWRHISANEITKRALRRLAAKGKGILLLHDIQPATALALPALLKQLKDGGYRIVHVVPSGNGHPKTPTTPAQWVLDGKPGIWPEATAWLTASNESVLPVPDAESFGVEFAPGSLALVKTEIRTKRRRGRNKHRRAKIDTAKIWPQAIDAPDVMATAMLPVPDAVQFQMVAIEEMLLAEATISKPIVGVSLGAATPERNRPRFVFDVPVVQIGTGADTLPIVPASHSVSAPEPEKAGRLRYGLRPSQWPIPAVLGSEPQLP